MIVLKGESKFEKERGRKIKDAQNFEELYEILKEKGGVGGSRRHYTADELIERIEGVRIFGLNYIMRITASEGLRNKVIELDEKARKENLRADEPDKKED